MDEAGDALDFEHQCCAAYQVNDKVRLVTMGSVVESIHWAALARVKSPREIDMIRRATQIAALGLVEAVKATEPRVYEYHLDAAARYVFLANDARLDGYRSITAAGVGNIVNATISATRASSRRATSC